MAVSGLIFVTGHVGDVGGIPPEDAAARSAGATHLLVAPATTTRPWPASGTGLTVLQVATLDEAIIALQGIGGELGPQREPAPVVPAP